MGQLHSLITTDIFLGWSSFYVFVFRLYDWIKKDIYSLKSSNCPISVDYQRRGS